MSNISKALLRQLLHAAAQSSADEATVAAYLDASQEAGVLLAKAVRRLTRRVAKVANDRSTEQRRQEVAAAELRHAQQAARIRQLGREIAELRREIALGRKRPEQQPWKLFRDAPAPYERRRVWYDEMWKAVSVKEVVLRD